MNRETVLSSNNLANINMPIVTECFTAEELFEAICSYSNSSLDKIKEFKAMGKRIRDIYFQPVNRENMSVFLNTETIR